MAAELKRQLGMESDLMVGNPGEFSVWIDGVKIADKQGGGFPPESSVVKAAQALLGPSAPRS